MFIFFSHLKLAFFNFRKFRKLKDIFKTFLNWTLPTVQRISFWLFSVPLTATLWKDKWLGIFINAFWHHSQGSIRLGPSLCPSSRNLLMIPILLSCFPIGINSCILNATLEINTKDFPLEKSKQNDSELLEMNTCR